MKFLKNIKQLFQPKEELLIITDETFGKLTFKELKNTNSNYWKGYDFFRPTNKKVEYFIRTKGQNLPSLGQKDFFLSLNQNYPSLSKLWHKTIDGEIGEVLAEMGINLKNAPFQNYFELSHLEIPEKFNDEADWNITFFATPEIDLDHEFTINMRGWDSLGLSING